MSLKSYRAVFPSLPRSRAQSKDARFFVAYGKASEVEAKASSPEAAAEMLYERSENGNLHGGDLTQTFGVIALPTTQTGSVEGLEIALFKREDRPKIVPVKL